MNKSLSDDNGVSQPSNTNVAALDSESDEHLDTQSNKQFWYVGFGSLINILTRPSAERLIPISLAGYQREWSFRNQQGYADITALNVIPDVHASITAVLVNEPISALMSLDMRESGYQRHQVDPDAIRFLNAADEHIREQIADEPIYIYRAEYENHHLADEQYPILQTYLDVVIIGLINVFSEYAAIEFVQQAIGLGGPILNDRFDPIYPRAISHSPEELAKIDEIMQHIPERQMIEPTHRINKISKNRYK